MHLSSHIIALLLRQCVVHAEYTLLDENNVSISKAEWVEFFFPAECWYTSSRRHSITTQKSKMLFIPDREHCMTNQRSAIRKYPLTYLYDLEQLCSLHMYAYIDTRYCYFYYM